MSELNKIEERVMREQDARIHRIFYDLNRKLNDVLNEALSDEEQLIESLTQQDRQILMEKYMQHDWRLGFWFNRSYLNFSDLSEKTQERLLNDGLDKLVDGLFNESKKV